MKNILLAIVLAWSATATEKLHTTQAHTDAHLVISHTSVPAGGTLRVGLFVEPDDGWHVYWSNPGDSGAAPILNWTLPEGLKVGPLDYPTPSRHEKGGLFGFGYAEGVLYSSVVEVPPSFTGKSIPVVLDAEWLVCNEICVPAKFRFESSVKVGPEGLQDRYRSLFDRFLGRLPVGRNAAEVKSTAESLEVSVSGLPETEILDFIPSADLEVDLKAPAFSKRGGQVRFDLKRTGAKPLPEGLGLLIYRDAASSSPLSVELVTSTVAAGMGIWRALFFAFFGGMMLNLMPCVFPVLSIKVLSLSSQSGNQKSQIRKTNLVYASGIIVALTLLGFALATLRSAGEALGWGFQLQTPWFLAALTYLFSLMGFVFLGSLDLSRMNVGYGQGLASKQGYVGEFFSGFLCVLVASPCTAPFMGAALGFAVTQPLPLFLSIFILLGVGLAFPYLLLSFFPTLTRFLPRPGAWMETLKEAMAFPLFLTVLWLIWVFGQIQGGQNAFFLTVAHLLIAMAIWAFSRKRSQALSIFGGMLIVGSVALAVYTTLPNDESSGEGASDKNHYGIEWQAFDEEAVTAAVKAGKPVFVDFTADWCLTCKVNERLTFPNATVQETIRNEGIQMFRADWTRRDPKVTRALEKYGRIGVPFYVAYTSKEKAGKPLGEVMTPDIFLGVFQSGESK